MITLTGDPGSGAVDGRRGDPRGLTGSAPPSSTVRQPLLPAFDFERRDCRSGRGLSRRPPPGALTREHDVGAPLAREAMTPGPRSPAPRAPRPGASAPASASTTVAAACFRARRAHEPSPARERAARVLAGYRRTASDCGRGQTRGFGATDLAAVLATCHRPRRRGRGVESGQVALERGQLDAVKSRDSSSWPGCGRSEVSALRWADIGDAVDGDGILVTAHRGFPAASGATTTSSHAGRTRRGRRHADPLS